MIIMFCVIIFVVTQRSAVAALHVPSMAVTTLLSGVSNVCV
jgi:hypothetical protein